jgi:RNA polymerase sigma-70 factor (sigma-E family)
VAFCTREHPRLVGALSLYCGDPTLAEELAQEALYRVCRDWKRVREMAAPGAWAHRVAINLTNSAFRRRRVERRANERHGGGSTDDGQAPETVIAVRQAVAALPIRQRAVVVLRHFLGYSVGETADLLGVSAGAVKQLSHRAAVTLRERLPETVVPEVPDVG